MIKDFIILPLTGFLIGYFTNWLAIKLLFWPREKTLGIQGVIPKRKEEITENLSSAYLQLSPKKLDMITKIPFIGKKIENYIKKEVALKINAMSDKELEKMIRKAVKKELFFIEISGGIIGFIVGLVEVVILILI